MKTIEDIIKKIRQDKLKELAVFLNLRGYSDHKIKSSLLNVFTIHKILLTLTHEELIILKLIYSDNDGISFGDIKKHLDLDIAIIEKSIIQLSNFMLIYVMKNRQLLNNKMDKVYCISEIHSIFKVSQISDIEDYLQNAQESLLTITNRDNPIEKIKDEKHLAILKKITEEGCVIPIQSLQDSSLFSDIDKKTAELYAKGYIKIFFSISEKLTTYIALNEDIIPHAPDLIQTKILKNNTKIYNGFNSIINLLHGYDVISSYGLFLTKQGRFRKIDIKKISDQMINIKNISGELYSQEESALFSIKILNIIGCLKLDKDIGIISLKNIIDIIEDPIRILKLILENTATGKNKDEIFESTIKIPEYTEVKTILSLLYKTKSIKLDYLKTAFSVTCNISQINQIEKTETSHIKNRQTEFQYIIEFMAIWGLIKTDGQNIIITEEGNSLYMAIKSKKSIVNKEIKKSIVINPDFTLMIQNADTDPVAIYIITSFTNIIKKDIIIETAITKNSIINANKRGMNIETFINTLQMYAKNEIPQNLEFLLNDWTNQTISLNISRQILLYSSHTSFLDEISYSSISDLIVKRIAENYAIINKDSIDDIIKFSKKFDVILNIFEDK